MDVAVLGLTIDSSGAIPQLKQVEGALKRVGQTAKEVESEATKSIKQQSFTREQLLHDRAAREVVIARLNARDQVQTWVKQAERDFQHATAHIRLSAARGFMTADEARKHGREAAMAYNAAVGQAVDRGTSMGAFSGRQGNAMFLQMSGGLKNVSQEAAKAGLNMGRLRESMTSMAASALHTAPGVAQVSSTLGGMAIGAPLMVGVLAGVAALTLAWRGLTKEAREAKKAQEEATARLEQIQKRQQQGPAGETPGDLTLQLEQIKRLQKQIDNEIRRGPISSGSGGPFSFGGSAVLDGDRAVHSARIAQLRTHLGEVTSLYIAGARDVAKVTEDQREEERRKAEEAENRYRRSISERIDIAKRATEIDGLRATGLSELEGAEAMLQKALTGTSLSLEKRVFLTEQLRQVQAALAAEEVRQAQEAERNRPRVTGSPFIPRFGRVGLTVGSVHRPDDRSPTQKVIDRMAADEAQKAAEAAKKAMDAVWDEAVRGMQRTLTSGFEAIQRDGLDGFGSFADSLVNVFQGAAANIASVLASRALGLDDLLARLKEMSPDEVESALLGEGLGDGNLQRFGAGAFAGGMAGFRGGIGTGVMSGAMSGLLAGGPAGAAVGVLAGFAGGMLHIGEAAKKAREEMRQFREDFTKSMQRLRAEASGDALGATIADLEAERDRMLRNAKQAFPGARKVTFGLSGRQLDIPEDPRRQDSIDDITADFDKLIERAKEAHALRVREAGEDARIRQLRAEGSTAAADAAEMALQHELELARHRKEFATDPAVIKAVEDAQAAEVKRAEENRARRNGEATEEFEIRRLVAEGHTMEAERRRFALDQQKELNELTISGLSDAARAAGELALAAEAAAFAAAQAKQQAELQASIQGDFLRSQGKDQEAAQFDLDHEQERRRQQAIDSELGQEWLDKLDKIFEWEDGELAARYMQDAADTMQDAAKINARRASEDTVRSVTAISESSALRLVDLSRSQVGLLAAIEMNTRGRPGDGVWVNSRSGGRGVVVHVTQQFYGPVTTTQQFTQQLGAEIGRQINEALGKDAEREARFTGSGAV